MKVQILKFFVLLLTLSTFFSCQNDDILIENSPQEIGVKTSQISLNQVINEIDNPKIKENLRSFVQINTHNKGIQSTNNSDIFFIKKEKDNLLTTYILGLNSYSQTTPYYLKFIITKNSDEEEKFGYLKYIPTNPSTDLDLHTFTGEIQILNFNFEVTAKSEYLNGIQQAENAGNGNANRLTCTNQITVTEVRCSNGGNHGVGGTCHDRSGNIIPNDAYFSISVTVNCTGRDEHLVQIIEDPSSGSYGGGVFSASMFLNPFLATLSPEQLFIYDSNPSIQEYLVNNLISIPNPNYNPLLGGLPTIIGIDPEAEEFVKEVIGILGQLEFETSTDQNNMANILFFTKQNNYFQNEFDTAFFNGVASYTAPDVHNPELAIAFIRLFSAHYAIVKSENPNWSTYEVFAKAWLDTSQFILELAGLVPVIGEFADITNGTIYLINGSHTNALLSYGSAIPIAGWFTAGVKFAKRADSLKYLVVGAENLISFGAANSKKFREVCGIAVGDRTRQAHHIIPRGSQIIEHEVVQKAAKSTTNQGFHIDQALNGIAVATWRNQPNHNAYNNLIKSKLDALPSNLTPNQAYAQLTTILNQAKQAIINNPNTHLNDLIF